MGTGLARAEGYGRGGQRRMESGHSATPALGALLSPGTPQAWQAETAVGPRAALPTRKDSSEESQAYLARD